MPGAIFAPWRKRRRSVGPIVPTAPAAPDTPSTPSPADTATAYFTLLSWVSARATKFDIYLDTVNPPTTIVVPKYNTTSYVPTLAARTTYYWKIVAFNDGGSATGPIWSFTTPAATAVLFSLGGTVTTSAQRDGLSIHDVLGAEPNSAVVTFNTAPTDGALVRIGLGTLDDSALLFGGEVQTDDQQSLGTLGLALEYQTSLIDHTFRLNRRRPFGSWINTSATTIAKYLVATFSTGFTSTHVQDGLPTVSINFDGSQDFMTCMRALATAISDGTNSGKTKVDYAKDVWLYLTYTGEQPTAIDNSHPPLNAPVPIRFGLDLSQIRTKVFGKGHGEALLADVGVGETILPIANAVMFTAAGGKAVASITSAGAQSQILTYAGLQIGGSGSLVGPGTAPSTAPNTFAASGTGLNAGTYQYAYTDVTASGESLPSPLATVVTGVTPAPLSAPTVGTPTADGSADLGNHDYEVTFVTATGETTPSAVSAQATAFVVAAPATTLTATATTAIQNNDLVPGDTVNYRMTFITQTGVAGHETTAGPASNTVVALNDGFGQAGVINIGVFPSQPAGVIGLRVYRLRNGASYVYQEYIYGVGIVSPGNSFSDGGWFSSGTGVSIGSTPGSNTANIQTVPLTGIPLGDANVTNRKLYRRFNATGTFKLVTTLNATDTTYTDTTANASLGVAAPSTNTATTLKVNLTGIAAGASPTSSRKVYRTPVNASQLKLLTTLGDNTTTVFTDTTADSGLGANAPTGDTSALTQAAGQVIAGATSMQTSSGAPFNAATGGWSTAGSQTFRYTGVSGNTLTGIPATGPGAILATVNYGSQVVAAPVLTGINSSNGVSMALAKGSSVNIFVQRDDPTAQTALGLLERDENGNPTDGIREYTITDERSTEDRVTDLCDAELAIFSRPTVTAQYYTRDTKSKAGRSVSIALTQTIGSFDPAVFDQTVFGDVVVTWGRAGTFTLQSVDITIDSPNANPLYHVTATSVAFTLSDLLRRVALAP